MNSEQVREIFSQNPEFPKSADLLLLVIDYCDNLVPKKQGEVLADLVWRGEQSPSSLLNISIKDAFRSDDIGFIKEVLEMAPEYEPELSTSDLKQMLYINSYNTLTYALERDYIRGDIKEILERYQRGSFEENTATQILSSYLLSSQLDNDLGQRGVAQKVKI